MSEPKLPVVLRVVNMDIRSPNRREGPVEIRIDLYAFRGDSSVLGPDPDMLVSADVRAALLEWLQS